MDKEVYRMSSRDAMSLVRGPVLFLKCVFQDRLLFCFAVTSLFLWQSDVTLDISKNPKKVGSDSEPRPHFFEFLSPECLIQMDNFV